MPDSVRAVWLGVLLAACTPAPRAPARPAALGLNDVAMLLPLPSEVHTPVLANVEGLISPAVYDALVTSHADIAPRIGGPIAFGDFHVVALRFDLCDRAAVGVCPAGTDGRLRVVLQPMYLRGGAVAAHDVALHAFYPVPAASLPQVIESLRALAALQGTPTDAPLDVSRGARAPTYVRQLRALIAPIATADRLVRLTVIGQIADSAAFAWVFRGVDRVGETFAPTVIPGVPEAEQSLQLSGGDTVYRTHPLVDEPAGFALATNGPAFAAASARERGAALEALAAVENPLVHDTVNTQCVGCHVSTFLTTRRAEAVGIAPLAIAGRFTAPLAATIARSDARVVRGFGWAASSPAISQRVVNDSAQVLAEIAARFPPR